MLIMILDSLNDLIFKPVGSPQIFQNLTLPDDQQKTDKEKGVFDCGTMLSSLVSSSEVEAQHTPSSRDHLLRDSRSVATSNSTQNSKSKIKNCVSNFSSFAHLIDTILDDPIDEMAASDLRAFKVKPSKSSKKRKRKLKKKMDNRLALISKAVNEQTLKKQRKKDVKKLARRLAKI